MGYLLKNRQYSETWTDENETMFSAVVYAGRWCDGIQKTIKLSTFPLPGEKSYIMIRAIRGISAVHANQKAKATVSKLKTMTLSQSKEWAKVVR